MEDMALNYSRQDLEHLVSEAERLVMPPRGLTTCADHHDGVRCGGDHYDGSSDSDYETRASREWLVRSEPNISLRHHQGPEPMVTSTPSEARRRPQRRSVTNRRPDWRLSLPECLEYYQPPGLTSDHDDDHYNDGRVSQASLPLSDLWEHELMADTEDENDNEKAALMPPANLTDFGEDYSQYLYSEMEETDSDIFSESDDDVNNSLATRQSSCFSRHSHKTQKSQTELKQLLIKTNPSHDSWKCEKELVSI